MKPDLRSRSLVRNLIEALRTRPEGTQLLEQPSRSGEHLGSGFLGGPHSGKAGHGQLPGTRDGGAADPERDPLLGALTGLGGCSGAEPGGGGGRVEGADRQEQGKWGLLNLVAG